MYLLPFAQRLLRFSSALSSLPENPFLRCLYLYAKSQLGNAMRKALRAAAVLALLMSNLTPFASAQTSAKDFVIDQSAPWAYIRFDHLGERKPANDWENTKGLWLRLVNNCKLPIQISVSSPGTGDPGVVVNFDVVPTPGRHAPNEEQRKKMPFGYAADIGTLVTIPPKGDLLFSVPAESVSERWYIQVRFEFALPTPKSIKGQPTGNYDPYMVADFDWYNIPEAFRK